MSDISYTTGTLVVRQDPDPFGIGASEALRLAQILPQFGGATCELAAAELRRQHAEIARLTVERDAAIDARRAAQLRQEQLAAEIVSLEPMRQRAAQEALIARVDSAISAATGEDRPC